jgi:hypothetical protein
MIEFPVSEKQGIARQSIAMIAFFADVFNANRDREGTRAQHG